MTDEDVKLVKEKIKKLDPALVMLAMQEMDIKTDEVEKVKEGIRGVYESISDTEKKPEILSKALAELEPEIIDKEIKNVKAILENIDKDVLLKATRDLETAASAQLCIKYLIGCGYRIICPSYEIICTRCVGYRIICLDCVGYRIICSSYEIRCGYRIICPSYEVGCGYRIICPSYEVGCGYRIICPSYEVGGCRASIGCGFAIAFEPPSPEEIVTREVKEETVKEVVKSPELSKAIMKMIKEMKKKGEI